MFEGLGKVWKSVTILYQKRSIIDIWKGPNKPMSTAQVKTFTVKNIVSSSSFRVQKFSAWVLGNSHRTLGVFFFAIGPSVPLAPKSLSPCLSPSTFLSLGYSAPRSSTLDPWPLSPSALCFLALDLPLLLTETFSPCLSNI